MFPGGEFMGKVLNFTPRSKPVPRPVPDDESGQRGLVEALKMSLRLETDGWAASGFLVRRPIPGSRNEVKIAEAMQTVQAYDDDLIKKLLTDATDSDVSRRPMFFHALQDLAGKRGLLF